MLDHTKRCGVIAVCCDVEDDRGHAVHGRWISAHCVGTEGCGFPVGMSHWTVSRPLVNGTGLGFIDE